MEIFKSWLVERFIAHRGLHDQNNPENSLGAFQNAIDNDHPIELDVHLISDGTVVVFHDSTLSRLTGKDGYVKNLTKDDLKNYNLANTEYTIPTLQEVLELVDGKVPLLIEIKNLDKVGELESATYKLLKEYKGEYAVQSFNPYSMQWFYNNAPDVIRGQLSSYFKGEKLSFFKKFVLKRLMLNKKVSHPDFICYDHKDIPNRFVKRFKNLPLIVWVITKQEDFLRVVKHCDNIIFENFEPKI